MTVTVNEQVAWFPEVSRASYAISVSPNGNVPTPAWSHSGNPEHVQSTEASPTLSVIVGGRQSCDPRLDDEMTGIVTSLGQLLISGASISAGQQKADVTIGFNTIIIV